MSVCLELSVDNGEQLLQQAAEDGHVPAMHAFGLQCDGHDEPKRWLREAAHEGTFQRCTTTD